MNKNVDKLYNSEKLDPQAAIIELYFVNMVVNIYLLDENYEENEICKEQRFV